MGGLVDDLSAILAGDPDRPPLQMCVGVVTQVSPLLVQVGPADTPATANKLGSYAPAVGEVVAVLVQGADRLVLGANTGALGYVGRAEITANSTPYGGSTTVSGLSVTFTAIAGRRYLISISCVGVVTSGTGTSRIEIVRGATKIADRAIVYGGVAGSYPGSDLAIDDVPGAGSVTYYFRTTTAATDIAVYASSTSPASIRVEDIGPA